MDVAFHIAEGYLAIVFEPLQVVVTGEVIALVMRHRNDHALACLKAGGEGRIGAADNLDAGVAADIFQSGIFNEDAGEKDLPQARPGSHCKHP